MRGGRRSNRTAGTTAAAGALGSVYGSAYHGSFQQSPLGGAIQRESEVECHRVYLTYLHLYLRFYSMLSERERKAIRLVEVDGYSYREAAAELAIKLENLKMVIFRARRKIHRSMRRVFEGLPPDCRPARDPKVGTTPAENPGSVGPSCSAGKSGSTGGEAKPAAGAAVATTPEGSGSRGIPNLR